ncbi:c-type cytochrome [Achromobacter sp. Root83]|uniref:cytochrome c oxidase subunit II n=1 Tax=Achromobacter sp. Root83 TaxID=1736602 RepID=UPI0009E97495|nr:c-type cytochrome [Achromobacter sp. Root83]
MAPILPSVLAAAIPLAAWARTASAAQPSGDEAGRIAEIGWVLFVGGAVIFIAVAAVMALALHGPPRARRLLAKPALIVAAGIAFPVIALTALLLYVLSPVPSLARHGAMPAARIEVTGELWWWRVRYLDPAGNVLFETANDIRIPAGLPVEFLLKSGNVIHSFWIPDLAGKLDMIPGRVNRLRVLARTPGVFRGQCAEYCGAQHARMMFDVEALPPERFDAWLQTQRQPARAAGPELLQGERIFQRACAQCHAVRGTPAAGTLGPDLTHLGSRPTLAAGVLPNNVGALAGWIAGSQHIKPGNGMPSFDQWPGEDLRAVARYLESLK